MKIHTRLPTSSFHAGNRYPGCLTKKKKKKGGARGVMVIVAGYGHGDTSSNPGPD